MSGYVCPECGLDYDTIHPKDAVVAVRSYPRRFRGLLTSFDPDEADKADALVRRRPDEKTWSALEYTGHVADVFAWMADTIRRMAVEDNPSFDFPDPDQQVLDRRYNERNLSEVLDGLRENADRLATVIDNVDAHDWRRTGRFDWGERDALTMMRNAVHEGAHHRRDVERVLKSVRGRR